MAAVAVGSGLNESAYPRPFQTVDGIVKFTRRAVVLETKQQYDESKLKPADPDSVPDLPEPAVWIMLMTALPCLWWWAWRRGRRAG